MIVIKVDKKHNATDRNSFYVTLRVDNDSQIVFEGIFGACLTKAEEIQKAIGFGNLIVTKEAIEKGFSQLESFSIL